MITPAFRDVRVRVGDTVAVYQRPVTRQEKREALLCALRFWPQTWAGPRVALSALRIQLAGGYEARHARSTR